MLTHAAPVSPFRVAGAFLWRDFLIAASYKTAFVADLVIAEPHALIGFAGPRVIEQTVREKLPDGFQRAEFLLEKGAIDLIVDRRQLRDELARLLTMLTLQPAPAA